MFVLKAGGIELPAPVSITINDEIIWSSDTGRTLDGTMIGDVIAQKKNISLKWQWLTEDQVKILKKRLIAGFFPLTFYDEGEEQAISAYRGTMAKEQAGDIGDGLFWYKSVSVDIVQK